MSKLPQVSGRNAVRVLQKIGFTIISQRGSHVKLVRTNNDQRQTVIVPMHKIIKKGTLRNGILKPINLTVNQFVALLKR